MLWRLKVHAFRKGVGPSGPTPFLRKEPTDGNAVNIQVRCKMPDPSGKKSLPQQGLGWIQTERAQGDHPGPFMLAELVLSYAFRRAA